MQTSATFVPRISGPASRQGAWLLRLWNAITRDEDERFLCEASDLADLERRLRRLERGRADRFGLL